MDREFKALVNSLHSKFSALVEQKPCDPSELPRGKDRRVRGVYLFSEGRRHLYVGRSNDIRGRHGRHSHAWAGHNMASFAFRLARKKTGKLKATYKSGDGSRKHLMSDPSFKKAFSDAKARIKRMHFRFVEEPDPLRQCLLEIYCAVVLQTPHNDWENH